MYSVSGRTISIATRRTPIIAQSKMTSLNENQGPVWKMPLLGWASIIAAVAVLTIPFYGGLKYMVGIWSSKEEYSHGYLIPLVTLFLIWQKKETLQRIP